MRHKLIIASIAIAMQIPVQGALAQAVDQDNTYSNPIIHADYSDPDLVRVGDDYWMTSSSFNALPALQILHSTDLINWEIVGSVFSEQHPKEIFDKPAHGLGVFAPSIRYHDGLFYIYWGDPDRGIYMVSAEHPDQQWSEPTLVKAGKGMIDPSPLWDDDGKAYLVHAWAASRVGFNGVLTVNEMTTDGKAITSSAEVIVFDGHKGHPTVEGPKFYKRGDCYYIFAPAGGVQKGWQLVLKADNVYGPYECRMVMSQGDSKVNGPHQGGWVDDVAGNSWFVHFQDCGAYGRIAHLQPMFWGDDNWCVIGVDDDNDGCGTPVEKWSRPATNIPAAATAKIATSDEFDSTKLGLQWQWHANSQDWWAMPFPAQSKLRVNTRMKDKGWRSLWNTPNLLLQKFPARAFTTTTKIEVNTNCTGDRFGLLVMGMDYATAEIYFDGKSLHLEQRTCHGAISGKSEVTNASIPFSGKDIYLRCEVRNNAKCQFLYSLDGKDFEPIGKLFTAKAGRWIGAKVGLFAISEGKRDYTGGHMNVDWFRIEE